MVVILYLAKDVGLTEVGDIKYGHSKIDSVWP